MCNVCSYYNPFTKPSYHDDGLVTILSISTSMGCIYKYLCRILTALSNKLNRYIFVLYNFESIDILLETMKNWGWYRNYIIFIGVVSFSYQTRVQIKIPCVVQ